MGKSSSEFSSPENATGFRGVKYSSNYWERNATSHGTGQLNANPYQRTEIMGS